MALHDQFEWDDGKATENLRKHRVSFEDAIRVLCDPFAMQFHQSLDDQILSEDRWITIASDPYNRRIVLVIVWTLRGTPGNEVTRLISARLANKIERQDYEEKTYPI